MPEEPEMKLRDTRVALVTGASSEIGSAISLTLADLDYHLALTGRDEIRLEKVAERCRTHGVQVLTLNADLADPQTHEEIIERTLERFGRLDVLIHNAGVFDWAAAAAADLGRWDELLDVNLRAAMRLTRFALPHILAIGAGAVIFIASMAGRFTFGMNAAYVASKHGLVGFAESLFEDARDRGVKVCAVLPGFVDAGTSRSMEASEETFAAFIQPQDVAEAVRYVLSSSATVCPNEIRLSPQKTPFGRKA